MSCFFLFSHERKKKYWEQLELRCRHLYRRPPAASAGAPPYFSGSNGLNPPPSVLVTPGSQCGYCTTAEDPRYYNVHAPTELYPGGLWASRTTSEANDGCYWNPQRSNGNIYSPNPEEMHRNENEDCSRQDENDVAEAENSRLTRSLSRSFRNWFPWLSSRIASLNGSSEVIMRPPRHPGRPNVNPVWRHSNPDSHYGFRQQLPNAASGAGYRGRYHLPSSGTTPADLSHYSAIPSGTR